MNRAKILASVFYFFLTAISFSQNRLLEKVVEFSQSDELRQAEWSVCAKYVDDGSEIISFNSRKNLAPASGLKVFTTSAALEYLGSDFRFSTKIFAEGEIRNGVLDGNLIIVGGGDPTLGSSKVKGSLPLDSLMNKWVAAVRNARIRKINGSVLANDELFAEKSIPDFWYWIDLGNYYAAQTSALTINDNLYKIFFKSGRKVGDPAEFLRTEPTVEGLIFVNKMKTGAIGSGDNGYVYRSPYDSIAYLRGTIPLGYKEFSIKGSLPDPPLFAANYFTKKLISSGIVVSGKPGKTKKPFSSTNAKLIEETLSPPLKAIVYNINKISNNLYTEQLLRTLALKKFGEGSEEKGIQAVKQFVAESGVDTNGLNLYDGCGLSRSNTITAEMMTDLLIANTHKVWFPDFYNSLAIAGDPNDDGHFGNFGKGTPLAHNGRIKSGFISGVRSHSGYVRTRSHRLIAFSLIANNFTCPVKRINKIHEKIIVLLSELK